MASWNLWHGCHKLSEGCRNCYVYMGDEKRGLDASKVVKTQRFEAPIQKNRKGEYKIPAGTLVYTCFTSDFFLEDADEWRKEAWDMIRARNDLNFLMITKRIHRLMQCVPEDWGEGYEHVTICCTVENQPMADERLPVYRSSPIKHKIIICEPLLESLDLFPYLDDTIEQVVVGGESGRNARICDYEWVLSIRKQCMDKGISFWFKQTGARFVKEGKLYKVGRAYQHVQARKADINYK